ncbi:MAG: type III-B CRISPR-associated protein Cas10/Cmr2 [Verrucomicrobia bacterium]|nr:type III-B CRISPR-associated protein Cas10/Cmr2 [Verrucomicrobiota bacterium]
MTDWRRKLAAYLHDPPEKAYDFGEHHKERARIHAESFGVGDLWRSMGGNPDWSAAAADRFVFPHGSKVGASLSEELKVAFVHPLSGRDDNDNPALPTGSLVYPGQSDAEQWLSDIRPEWKSSDPQTLFLRAWRRWSEHAADHAGGKGRGAELLPYLSADTRIPDGSIWHHCAVVSALEATRAGQGGELQPAFLIFQVGPVQDFIAQARSTRDLWSGSYLLSWLTMHAIKAVADQCGPDAIIFPGLKGQPIYDFLERRLDLQRHDNEVLIPGIPNRFLALVAAGFSGADVENAFRKEWRLIAQECQAWLKEKEVPFNEHHQRLWDEQIDRHWQLTWQLWPWRDADRAIAAFKALPLGAENSIHLAKEIVESIPEAHNDERCYRGGQLDPGWAWSAHYQLCQHAIDARRSLRDFRPFDFDATRKPGHRDALSGREEAVVQSKALEDAVKKSAELRPLFRHIEPLGAANLIKRVWHKAYLFRLDKVESGKHLPKLERAKEAFDSVSAVAAAGWLEQLRKRMETSQDLWADVVSLSEVLEACSDKLWGVAIPAKIGRNTEATEDRWLDRIDAEIFTVRFWTSLGQDVRSDSAIIAAANRVETLKRAHKLGEPPAYYAVLALDGDQIGRWLSGEKSPRVGGVMSPKARDYFEQKMLPAMSTDEKRKLAEALQKLLSDGNAPEKPADWKGQWPPQSSEDWIRSWLASPRPISPSWHLQFSEALANFGLYAARRIVEEVHHGQLIYSGGDDVLAMLPADEAVACAANLRAAFQGRLKDMTDECRRLFRQEAPEGFLWLAEPKPGEPSWPLLVPGPRMTVSVGLAIGHIKEPLQDLIQEAQRAEKRAKAAPEKLVFDRSDADSAKHAERWKATEGWDRDALAVTLFKRSGETIHWGARFESPAFALLHFVQKHYRTPWDDPKRETAITGRFPYRLAELLHRYGETAKTSELLVIARKEIAFVISRQTCTDKEAAEKGLNFTREDFERLCGRYLEHLAQFAWTHPNEAKTTPAPRPLREFINLFLLEAFIRRQAD